MSVTYEDYLLLRFLSAQPNITYSELAKQFNTSIHTIKRRISRLRSKGLYRGYYAVYNPSSLGLNRFFVFLYLDSVQQFSTLEHALDLHPYTVHRARFYSPQIGIFAQFDFPSEYPKLLVEFLDGLKGSNIMSTYSIVRSCGVRIRKSPDIKRFLWNTMSWDYDWSEFQKYLQTLEPGPLPKKRKSVIDKLNSIDLIILRKLTYDAEITQRELGRQLNLNRTTIWRKIKFLYTNVIDGFNAKINRTKFNLTSNRLFVISFHKFNDLLTVFNAFNSPEISPPFRYHIEIIESQNSTKNMLVYFTLPPHHEAQFVYSLADLATWNDYSLDISGSHSIRYAFYPENFDSETRQWKNSKDYVVTEPLSKLFSS